MKFIVFSALLTVISGLPQYDYPPARKPGRKPSGGGSGGSSGGRPSSKYLPTGGRPGGQMGGGGADEEPLIQKHVYLHVPPPELEEAPAPPKAISSGRKEKHYKIIFVKAPAPALPKAPVIPPSADREEKTIVYVLVKKPEDADDIILPTPAPTEPVKPEVYFIRYKSNGKKDGEEDGGDDGVGYGDGRPTFGVSPEYLPAGTY